MATVGTMLTHGEQPGALINPVTVEVHEDG